MESYGWKACCFCECNANTYSFTLWVREAVLTKHPQRKRYVRSEELSNILGLNLSSSEENKTHYASLQCFVVHRHWFCTFFCHFRGTYTHMVVPFRVHSATTLHYGFIGKIGNGNGSTFYIWWQWPQGSTLLWAFLRVWTCAALSSCFLLSLLMLPRQSAHYQTAWLCRMFKQHPDTN